MKHGRLLSLTHQQQDLFQLRLGSWSTTTGDSATGNTAINCLRFGTMTPCKMPVVTLMGALIASDFRVKG